MIAIIDNYGSFTYNLYQAFGEINAETAVFASGEVTIEELQQLPIRAIVLSSGASTPDNTGIARQVLAAFAGSIPILGVGLGHLVIAEYYGASVVQAQRITHGKSIVIHHSGDPIFNGINNPFKAACYHSLIVKSDSVPDQLHVLAVADTGEVMAVRHREHLVFGLQFHPEGTATECGRQLLDNFLKLESLGGGSGVV
jgi:anthranilate synthase/aminodeoxychorismate synthase-like glutamine amidotransferase